MRTLLALSLVVVAQTAAAQPAAPPAAPPAPLQQTETAEAQAFRRHAMLRSLTIEELQHRYERQGRAFTAVGALVLAIGAGTGVAAAVIGDTCDDDDWVCFPVGPMLAIPAVVFGGLGIAILAHGAAKRRRARAIQLSLGLASARLRLQF